MVDLKGSVGVGVDECAVQKEVQVGVKSDGGSSSYYEIHLPPELVKEAYTRFTQTGRCFIETEDIIRYGLANDFDRGNIFKCMVRITSKEAGHGKVGNTAEYDANKVFYTAEKMCKHYSTTI